MSRTLSSAALTAVWLISAVVLSRRISGDLTGFHTEWAACLVGAAGMGLTLVCVSQVAFRSQSCSSSAAYASFGDEYRILVMALSALPSVVLGLALLPENSGAGVAALPVLFLITVGAAALNTMSDLETQSTAEKCSAHKSGSDIDSSTNVSTQSRSVESPLQVSTVRSCSVVVAGDQPLITGDELEAGAASPAIIGTDSKSDSQSNGSVELESGSVELESESTEAEVTGQRSPGATQWMTRSIVDEYDVMEGGFRITLAAGQRQVAVHLPFSPAFSCVPEFECEPLDDSAVRIRTTAVHSYGVRIEATRSTNLDKPECIEIGWCASAATARRAAA